MGKKGKRTPYFIVGMAFLLLITVEAFSATFVDEAGRKLELKSPPQRMISVAPSVTEILFAIGLGDKLVGVTSYCNYPPEASKKERVGGYINPSLEKIVALRPNLVLGIADGDLRTFVNKLTGLGIAVYITNPKNVSEVILSIRKIGEVTFASEKANLFADSLRKREKEITDRVQGQARPRVLHIMAYEPLFSSAKGSFVDDLISLAGGRNVAADAKGRHPRLSMEEVMAQDPEVIILSSMTSKDSSGEQRQRWERWKEISAVRSGRIYVIDADILLRPSPRIIDGLEQMARAIHPEAFSTGVKGPRVLGFK